MAVAVAAQTGRRPMSAVLLALLPLSMGDGREWLVLPQQYAPWWDDLREPGGRVAPRTAAARACAPGCGAHGNCNLWTGECECPHNRHGLACERLVLPACRLDDGSVDVRLWMSDVLAHGVGASPYVGPLSCDCLRQALSLRHYLHIAPPNSVNWQRGRVSVICAAPRSRAPAAAGRSPGELGDVARARGAARKPKSAAADGTLGGGGDDAIDPWLTVERVLDAPHEMAWLALAVSFTHGETPDAVFAGLGSAFFRTGAARPAASLTQGEAVAPPAPHGRSRSSDGFHQTPRAVRSGDLGFRALAPRALCVARCGGHGACTLRLGTPVCECFAGARRTPSGSCEPTNRAAPTKGEHDGLACTKPHGRECAGAGKCDGNGFCRCDAGRWGVDCAHALDARGRPVVRASGARAFMHDLALERPHIFVYTLPPLLSTGPGFYADLYAAITLRLLESAYRTANPDEADYWWIPGPLRYGHTVDKLTYTRARWPYWNASAARRDGIARHITYAGWELDPGKIYAGPHTPVWRSGQGGLDEATEAQVHVASPERGWLSLSHNGMDDGVSSAHGRTRACLVCFQAGKDIVIPFKPGVIDVPRCAQLRARSIWSAAAPRRTSEGRDTIFFFAGSHPVSKANAARHARAPELAVYAPPHVREDIHALHNRTPGFKVVNSRAGPKVDPVEWMLRSQFCWVPPGQRRARRAPRRAPVAPPLVCRLRARARPPTAVGRAPALASVGGVLRPSRYGDPRRHILSAPYGCIPVFTVPNARLTLDEVLPWRSMAVVVPRAELRNLPAILARYSERERERMRAQLRCAWPRLWFSSIYGGCFGERPEYDAFDALIATLRYRIRNASIVKPAHASSDDACAARDRPMRRGR